MGNKRPTASLVTFITFLVNNYPDIFTLECTDEELDDLDEITMLAECFCVPSEKIIQEIRFYQGIGERSDLNLDADWARHRRIIEELTGCDYE